MTQRDRYDDEGSGLALAEAQAGFDEGGLPIGAALATPDGVIALGRNRRVQLGSATRHAEMDCLENAGRLPASVYREATLYSTLSPCYMCSGAIVLFGIPRVVIGGEIDFEGPRAVLESNGVEVVLRHDQAALDLIERFIAEHPAVWAEDIGEVPDGGAATTAR
jgi:creatinine deaminase